MAIYSSIGQSIIELLMVLFVLCALFFASVEIYNKGSKAIAQWRWSI